MTSEMRTPEDIERAIEKEREDMKENINTLQKKFSVDGIMGDVSDMLRERGGDISRIARDTVGRNPAAVAVIGAGLAWLLLSKSGSDAEGGSKYSSFRSGTGRRNASYPTGRGYATAGGSGLKTDGMNWLDDNWDNDTGWAQESHGGGVTGAVKRGASAAVQTAKDAVGAVRDRASDLTERLAHGTDGLSDTARERVVAARRAAYEAQRTARDAIQRGAHVAGDAFDNQPLVVGALALAIGAGIGASLPRTRIEDKTLGASSDGLISEAQRIFHEEVRKARETLHNAADEGAPSDGPLGLVTPV